VKYFVLLCDGMSDYKIPELGNKILYWNMQIPLILTFLPDMADVG